jgi:hypothetical protein
MGEIANIPQPSSAMLQEKARHLQKMLDESIEDARAKMRKFRRRASVIKVATILLAGLGTILLGLQIAPNDGILKQIAFVLGAIVTMLTALEPFFNYRALWVEHELALAGFYRIRDELAFYLSGARAEDLDPKVLKKLHDQYQTVWEQLSSAWIGYRRAKGPEKQMDG